MTPPPRKKPKPRPAPTPEPVFFNRPAGIDLGTHKTIRIAVSGDVALNRLETALIDTPDFQRLRRIRQLGATDLIYPSAVHTRFEHSLGVLAMTGEMIRAIRDGIGADEDEREIDPEREQLARLVALLHDIGHVPFGHTLEDEFRLFPRHDEDAERMDRFLGESSPIGRLVVGSLGRDLHRRLLTLLRADGKSVESLGEDAFIYDLVNNTVCADLLDYLRRDCYFCNITLDLDYRFLRYMTLRREGRARRAVVRLWKEGQPAPRRDVISELIRLLDNRYLMSERVYYHHAKLTVGAMIAGATQRAVMAGELRKTDLYDLGDETLLDRLVRSDDPAAARLARAVRDRKLWKLAHARTQLSVSAEQQRSRDLDVMRGIMETWWRDPVGRARREDRAAALLGLERGDMLVHCPSSKMSMKLAETRTLWNGQVRALKDLAEDPLIGAKLGAILKSHENLWGMRAFVHPDVPRDRDLLASAMDYMFSFEPARADRFERVFCRGVVDERAAADGLAAALPHAEYERLADLAAARLIEEQTATQTSEDVGRIIASTFAPALAAGEKSKKPKMA